MTRSTRRCSPPASRSGSTTTASACWRPSSRGPRSSASAATTPSTPPSWATRSRAAPLLFLKPNTSVIGPDDPIVLPDWTEHVEHEAELAIVIGKVTKDVPADRALDHVFGFTVANDVTARDVQRADSQWTRGKGFDGSCPIGPWIVPGLDVDDLYVRARVNGELKQDGRTSQMIFDAAYLVSYVSEVFTLLPGDLILTGTPAGVSPIVDRDIVEVEVEEIGVLRNPVLRRH